MKIRHYQPERDLPEAVRAVKSLSFVKLSQYILAKRNFVVSEDAIRMWFKRNPQVYEQLERELVEGVPTEKQVVTPAMFEPSIFKTLPSIKRWITYMTVERPVKEASQTIRINSLKAICMGKTRITQNGVTIDLIEQGKGHFLHPDRLTYEDGITVIAEFLKQGADPYPFRTALKSFLISQGKPEKVSRMLVGRARGFGKFATLYVDLPTISKMLEWIKAKNYEAYVADRAMLATGLRVNALLESRFKDMTILPNGSAILDVLEKGLGRKYGMEGRPIRQNLNIEIVEMIRRLKGENQKVFSINNSQLGKINSEALRLFTPETIEQFGHVSPNHFWRHMFFQHMLRRTGWNKAFVAEIGHTTEQSLTESYGQPPEDVIREWSAKYDLNIRA